VNAIEVRGLEKPICGFEEAPPKVACAASYLVIPRG
jgi:hypothetical protein